MHASSFNTMQYFRDAHLEGKTGKVLDIGSRNINGTYKDLFHDWKYVGLDIVPGGGVDYVAEDPYHWKFKDNSFDLVISGQTFEHIEFPEQTAAEILRVLKPGGLACIIAPSAGPAHSEPDYRRYTVAMLTETLKGLEVIESGRNMSGPWFDAWVIARKPIEAKGVEIDKTEAKPGKRSKAD